jgi:hypothetical protein
MVRSKELFLKKPKRKQGPWNGKLKLGMRIVALAEKQRAEQAARSKELESLFRGEAPTSNMPSKELETPPRRHRC